MGARGREDGREPNIVMRPKELKIWKAPAGLSIAFYDEFSPPPSDNGGEAVRATPEENTLVAHRRIAALSPARNKANVEAIRILEAGCGSAW